MMLEKLLCAELKRQLETKGSDKLSIPAGGELLWRWFCDLHATRTYHFAGPNPISHAEIEAYARLQRWPLEPRHVALIRAMDEVFLRHAAQKRAVAPEGTKAMPPVSTTPLTAGMLDAIFG